MGYLNIFMHTQNNTQATEKSHRDKMNFFFFFYIFNEPPSFLDICNNTQIQQIWESKITAGNFWTQHHGIA